MSKEEERLLVRQGGRFQCQHCGNFTLTQYAHIRPESDGGEYKYDNLLLLCYPCHRTLEPVLAKGPLKDARIAQMQKIKETKSVDSLVGGVFDELLAGSDVVVRLGSGIKTINCFRIFTEDPSHYPDPSYLDVFIVDGKLHVRGNFKDERGEPIIEFNDTNFRLFTGDFWDIIRKPRELEIKNISQEFHLAIKQNDDLSLSLMGTFFLGNMPAIATKDDFKIGGVPCMNCTFAENRIALVIG